MAKPFSHQREIVKRFFRVWVLTVTGLLWQMTLFAQTTVLIENFEGAFPGGWSVGDANTNGTTAYWKDVDLRAFGTPPLHGGNWAGYCAGVGFGGLSTSPTYQNSMSAFMSRSINLSGFSVATLSFWYVIPSVETGFFPPYDYLRVRVDGTQVFVRDTSQSTWTQTVINLDAYAGGTHTLTFEFISDGSFSNYEGAYLDDIMLVGNDPDDQISEALAFGSINQTRMAQGQINSPTDVDIYSISVQAGQRISFDIDQASAGFDSYIRLFDATGTQLAEDDDTPGPGETNSFTSYLEYTFANTGTYYLGVSGYGNTNYSATTGAGDDNGSTGSYTLVVSPGLAGTIRRPGDSTDFRVDVLRFGTTPLAINPYQRTWIVMHGWMSSRTNENIFTLASNLLQARPGDQVLTLDWSPAAATVDPFAAESSILPVAQWLAPALVNYGLRGTNLNFTGHSFGSYVADETAQRVVGGVNSIVSLDAAENIAGGYDPEDPNEVNFARDSQFSWAFHSSTLGSGESPITADEAFVVTGGPVTAQAAHSSVVFLFAYMIAHPTDLVGQYFLLSRLLTAKAGPWVPNQYYSQFLLETRTGGYEANIVANSDGRVPISIDFVILPSVSISKSGTNVAISWKSGYSNFVLQSSSDVVQPNSWANVGAQPAAIGQSNVVILTGSQSKQFFRLRGL